MNKVKHLLEHECNLCGNPTKTKFNISFTLHAICEQCADAIVKQQMESLIENNKKNYNV